MATVQYTLRYHEFMRCLSVCKKQNGAPKIKENKPSTQLAKFVSPPLGYLGYLGWAEAVAVGHVARVLFLLVGDEAAVASVHRRNAVAGPAHGARLAAVGAPALAPHTPLGPVARRHVAGALLLLVGHGTPETAVIRRDAVTGPGIGSWAITGLTRTYAPVSPLCEWALWHVTGALFLVACLLAGKLAIISRDAISASGPGANLSSSTEFSCTFCPFSPLCEGAFGHVTGALFLIHWLFAAKLTIISRDALSVYDPGANFPSSTEFSCTFCPFSPVSVRAFRHVTRPFFLISCLSTGKLTIIRRNAFEFYSSFLLVQLH